MDRRRPDRPPAAPPSPVRAIDGARAGSLRGRCLLRCDALGERDVGGRLTWRVVEVILRIDANVPAEEQCVHCRGLQDLLQAEESDHAAVDAATDLGVATFFENSNSTMIVIQVCMTAGRMSQPAGRRSGRSGRVGPRGSSRTRLLGPETLSLCPGSARSGLGCTMMPSCALQGRIEDDGALSTAPTKGSLLAWAPHVNRTREQWRSFSGSGVR